ncbi:MAG: TSUP family transporter [Pseudomonadota bacterium]|nr:TSUP family transporter [Pseudomonadota bacterium]
MTDFSPWQLAAIGLIFVWTGFVRTGLGFGGAALGLPLMLLFYDSPLFWLPIVAIHLLIFASLTVYKRLDNVDWKYLRKSLAIMIVPKLAGIMGLLSLPDQLMTLLVYGITLTYGIFYLLDYNISSRSGIADNLLLVLGAYISGTSLIGAPLIMAVYVRHVPLKQLRDTLFVLWFILVAIKMTTFVAVGVDLHWRAALLLVPLVAIGHVAGLKAHNRLLSNQGGLYRRLIGGLLTAISSVGLLNAAFRT